MSEKSINRDLKKVISEGKFREELFWRLNVITIEIPPLRDRKIDIPEFVKSFINKTLIYLAQLFFHPFPKTHPLTPSLTKRRGIKWGGHPPLFPREGDRPVLRSSNYYEG